MKKIALSVLCGLMMTSCITSILSYTPTPVRTTTVAVQPTPVTTTTVTTYSPRTHSTTVVAASAQYDFADYLDLRGIAAAFAEANTIQDFEMRLNSPSYMLSNLDLNRDGFVDYLRVMEGMEGYYHVLVIQAVLGMNMYQDVATIVAEYTPGRPIYVQVIGNEFIYGPNYIICPTYVRTPLMCTAWGRPHYQLWHSPYYWDHFPSHYHHPAPQHMSHYQAYMNTYMHNHHYCNTCSRTQEVHYDGYTRITRGMTHNDYGQQHPDQSYSTRHAQGAGAQTSRTSNTTSTTTTTTTSNGRNTSTTTTTTTTTSPARNTSTSSSRSNATTTTTTPSRNTSTSSSNTSTSTSRSTSSTRRTPAEPSTTVQTRINTSTNRAVTRTTVVDEQGKKTTTTSGSSDRKTTSSSSDRRTTSNSSDQRSTSTSRR